MSTPVRVMWHQFSRQRVPHKHARMKALWSRPGLLSPRKVNAGIELDEASAARAFGEAYFNLIRRGADGSLTLSADRWRLARVSNATFHFDAQEPDVPRLVVHIAEVERVVWDRLPRQQVRSQLRFFLKSGDVWTFSGSVDESALPE